MNDFCPVENCRIHQLVSAVNRQRIPNCARVAPVRDSDQQRHGQLRRLQSMARGVAYQSMRASGALANMLPVRVEFFGIVRRR